MLGKTLLIANPAAQNGEGAQAARTVVGLLKERLGEDSLEVSTTLYPYHAAEIAAGARGFKAVVALGGDGIIHETANGLMKIAAEERPAMGIVPVGSGNDFAQTLRMSTKLDKAVDQLMGAEPVPMDLGLVNGRFFVETLSFGLDAAIALDTMERRKRTGRTGTMLYLSSALDQLINHMQVRHVAISLDGGPFLEGESYLLAVQNGLSYGGGFNICPHASIVDGQFDICIARPPLSRPKATYILLRAKNGHHLNFPNREFYRAKEVVVKFSQVPPTQVDGEKLEDTTYRISMVPKALRILAPKGWQQNSAFNPDPAPYPVHEQPQGKYVDVPA